MALITGTLNDDPNLDGTPDGFLTNDSIFGLGGNDTIHAGDGNDYVETLGGNDIIDGGEGNDTIFAGNGDNEVDGGTGNNLISTGSGDDIILAGNGNNTVLAGDGENQIALGNGTNFVLAGSGGDQVTTGSGSDTIIAGAGNDVISSGAGTDILKGDAGDDRLSYSGTATISGGTGSDTIVISPTAVFDDGYAAITVTDFEVGGLGDKLEVVDLIDRLHNLGMVGDDPFANGWARLAGDGSGNTELQVDFDGPSVGSPNWVNLATLIGVAPESVTPENFFPPLEGVNDPPENHVPGPQSADEDTSLAFTGINQISVTDPDSNLTSTELSVSHGKVTVTLSGGTVSGTDVTITGTQAEINTALQTLTYKANADYNGGDVLTVLSTDGSGIPLSDTDTIAITVNAVADIVNDTVTTNEDTPISFNPIAGTNGAEADSFADSPQITHINSLAITEGGPAIAVTDGEVTLGAGNVLTFTPAADFNGAVPSFTYTVLSGGVSETGNIDVTVNAVDDDLIIRSSPCPDDLNGGNGNDTFLVERDELTGDNIDGHGGTDTLQFTGNVTLGSPGFTMVNVENLDMGGFTLTVQTAATVDLSGLNLVTGGTINGNGLNNTIIGTKGSDTINGGGGADFLAGAEGDDILSGGTGNDVLVGGLGNDVLSGDGGSDTFVFNTALGPTNVDRINSFSHADDTVQLDAGVFASLLSAGPLAADNFRASAGGNAGDATDFVLYDTNTGNLFYDHDGNGGDAKVQFARIVGLTGTLDATDFNVTLPGP